MPKWEEKRNARRYPRLNNHRIEIKIVGEPIYQFRVTDVSTRGAGLLINNDSAFLKLITVGQELDANFISPQGTEPSGNRKIEIRHVTELNHSRYKGVQLVGVRILDDTTTGKDPVEKQLS